MDDVLVTLTVVTALACVAALVPALLILNESFAGWLIAGNVLYLVGTIGLTTRAAAGFAAGAFIVALRVG